MQEHASRVRSEGIQGSAVARGSDGTNESALTSRIRNRLRPLEQQDIVSSIGIVRSNTCVLGISCRANARLAIQGVDDKPRIIGYRDLGGNMEAVELSFKPGILLERAAGFFRWGDLLDPGQGKHVNSVSFGCSHKVSELARIGTGDEDSRHRAIIADELRYTADMTIVVNGEPKECADGLSLAEFVAQLGLKADRVAVELNRQIAARNRWSETALQDGDRLEIVHFVGGGCSNCE